VFTRTRVYYGDGILCVLNEEYEILQILRRSQSHHDEQLEYHGEQLEYHDEQRENHDVHHLCLIDKTLPDDHHMTPKRPHGHHGKPAAASSSAAPLAESSPAPSDAPAEDASSAAPAKRATLDTKALNAAELKQHNMYRAKATGVTAMALDAGLTTSAQAYANKLAAACKMEHSGGAYGENLYMCGSTQDGCLKAGASTDAWYAEIKDYNFAAPGFSMKTGHYTQVVWKKSLKVGFGYACNKCGTWYNCYGVGQYLEAGNMQGSFPANVVKPSS